MFCYLIDERDYLQINSSDFNKRNLNAYNNTDRACVPVTIEMDTVYEGPETFFLDLSSPESIPYLFITPSVYLITILDTTGRFEYT